jgi:hypothetical protein
MVQRRCSAAYTQASNHLLSGVICGSWNNASNPEHPALYGVAEVHVSESGPQNIPIGEAMALTGYRSVQTFIGYYRSGAVGNSAAAQLMDQKVT